MVSEEFRVSLPLLKSPGQYFTVSVWDLDGALAEVGRSVSQRMAFKNSLDLAGAVRLYGGKAVWKDVAQRLLDDTCQQRTGRYEEDGCWPGFEPT
jgi:hypothetical protein